MKGGLNNPRPIDDTPINGNVNHAVSSNWAFDHAADLDAHTRNIFVQLQTGVYINTPFAAESPAVSLNIVANTLYAVPFLISRAMTPAEIFIFVETLAAGPNNNLRLGIYNDNGSLYPGTRLTNGGVVDVSATGIKTVAYTTQLTKGIYWVAFVADGVPKLWYNSVGYLSLLGHATLPYFLYGGWNVAQAYGNLPDPFTAGGVVDQRLWAVGFNFTSMD